MQQQVNLIANIFMKCTLRENNLRLQKSSATENLADKLINVIDAKRGFS